MSPNILLRFFIEKESSSFIYFLIDQKTRNALIIDPVLTASKEISKFIEELSLNLIYSLETHLHADHVTCGAYLRSAYGTKLVAGKLSGISNADIYVDHLDIIELDKIKITTLFTPGHTDGDVSYLWENHVFTGDTLLYRSCGRTDFQMGSSEKMFSSIKDILYKLPDETIVHPAHDYKGNISSRILEEKVHNVRINEKTNLSSFIKTMSELKLDYPKMIDFSLPRNRVSGNEI